MTKVPNILDHLSVMAEEAKTVMDKMVLMTAMEMCAEFIRTKHHPPSWPLNLDEWECAANPEVAVGDGWWLLPTGDGYPTFVRRRQSRPEQVTLSGEENIVKHLPGCVQSRGCVPGCPNYDPKYDG